MLCAEGDLGSGRRQWLGLLVEAMGLAAMWLLPGWVILALWVSFLVVRGFQQATMAIIALAVSWASLLVLTPFYHPYARLWLPLQSCNWLFMGATFAWVRAQIEVAGRDARWSRQGPLLWFAVACGVGTGLQALSSDSPWRMTYPSLLRPSDSVRQASQSIVSELPKDVVHLRILGRPPFIFYFAQIGRVAVFREPDLAHFAERGDPKTWALLDVALTRQDNVSERELERSLTEWALFREIPTTLSPPTLLDIDPGAARGLTLDVTAPVRLLRPRRAEEVR
jgi:hypothetical protein